MTNDSFLGLLYAGCCKMIILFDSQNGVHLHYKNFTNPEGSRGCAFFFLNPGVVLLLHRFNGSFYFCSEVE